MRAAEASRNEKLSRFRTWSSDGAPTRSNKHRDRIGPMILLVELAQRITRKLDVYFSIVRRSADWASRDMPSASLMITTVDVRVSLSRTMSSGWGCGVPHP